MKKIEFGISPFSGKKLKLLLIIKLTFLLTMVCSLQLYATVYSQATKFSFEMKNQRILDVLREIEKNSDFRFFYQREQVDVERKVNLNITDKTVEEILPELFEEQEVIFDVRQDNLILIKPEKGPIESSTEFYAQQQKTVSGKVTDNSGQPLPGVTVVVKGTSNGTVTNADGSFTISNIPEDAVMQFSFVGMKTQEIAVEGKTVIDVTLADEVIGIEEVVAVGYGTQNKRAVTGSTSLVTAKEMNLVNTISISNALQGKASGLQVFNYTAQPGGNSTIRIRGSLSPNGSNDPLYVIDGVPILNNGQVESSNVLGIGGSTDRNPLNTINPNDIESVSILKDASATAIYGSAAANGVILITTKGGKEGKVIVNFSSTYSVVTRKDNYLKPLNDHDFKYYHEKYTYELYLANNRISPYGNTDPSKVKPYVPTFSEADINSAGVGNNYLDYVTQDGVILDENISIQGGNANTRVFTSFNYFDQDGLIKESGLKRYAGRINVDQKIGSLIDLSLNLTYSEIQNRNQNAGQQAGGTEASSIIQSSLAFGPGIPLLDENGIPSKSYNFRIDNPNSLLQIHNTSTVRRLLFSPDIQFNITKGLRLNLVGGLDQNAGRSEVFVPVGANIVTLPLGYGSIQNSQVGNYSAEGYLTFDKDIQKNSLTVILGGGYYKTKSWIDGFNAQDFPTDAFGINNLGIAANKERINIYTRLTDRVKVSQFTRINYSFNQKYIFTLNGRFDGSSIWAEGNKWGFFPGASAAWILSDESFIKNDATNLLKLRVGYGSVGNEGLGGNYSLSLYGNTSPSWTFPFGYPSTTNLGVMQTQLGNPELRWETDVTANVGLDFGFFNNRITGSMEYFSRTAKDLFDFQTLPSANPIGRIGANIGSTRSRGFELELQTVNVDNGQFNWTMGVTLSTYKSYWLERNPEIKLPEYVKETDPIRAVYGWKSDGLITDINNKPDYQPLSIPGNIKYIDTNNDGKLDIKDVQYLGNTDPKLIYGFDNKFTYKDFDLSVFITGTSGGIQWDNWRTPLNVWGFTLANPYNTDKHVLDSWSSFNPNGKYPGVNYLSSAAENNNPSATSDFLARNVFWGRVRNITFGYTLPKDAFGKTIQSLRLFVDLQNFITFGNYDGVDPEMERNNAPYPTARTTAFGLSVGF